VTTLAGSGNQAYADGNGTAASFNYPQGVAVDSSGNVYVADIYNNRIRKILGTKQ
jgi:DNA-binding beta-propeller fold protein YncE